MLISRVIIVPSTFKPSFSAFSNEKVFSVSELNPGARSLASLSEFSPRLRIGASTLRPSLGVIPKLKVFSVSELNPGERILPSSELSERLIIGASTLAPSFRKGLLASSVDSDDQIRFKHRLISDKNSELGFHSCSTPSSLLMDEKRLWDADIRESSFKVKTSQSRNYFRYVWASTKLAGVAAALFLLLQFIFMATDIWTNFQVNKIAERSDEVTLVEQKNNLLLRIEQIAQNELKPFEMLATMNLKRPNSIYFSI